MTHFAVPANWGGRMQVVWNISTWRHSIPTGYEYESANFTLRGTANGCKLLNEDSTPVP
jgi:hypothetical protein